MPYYIQVIGRLYNGVKGVYEYRENIKPKNILDIRSIAKDFREVLDYQTTKTVFSQRNYGDKVVETKTTVIITKWKNPNSSIFYNECLQVA